MAKLRDFEYWKDRLESLTASEALRCLSEELGHTARFSTSLSLEDQIITHLISTHAPALSIFTLDTGRLFQETYDLVDLTRNQYKLNIETYYPDHISLQKLVTQKGMNSFYESVENRKECCYIRKVEPLKRALSGATCWITGIRAEQSSNRQSMSPIEWDDEHHVIKYHPLFYWSLSEVEEFINTHHVPVNALHRKGYPSIGCAPCTRAVAPGEDPRSGRWWWEGSAKECGLHQVKNVTT